MSTEKSNEEIELYRIPSLSLDILLTRDKITVKSYGDMGHCEPDFEVTLDRNAYGLHRVNIGNLKIIQETRRR